MCADEVRRPSVQERSLPEGAYSSGKFEPTFRSLTLRKASSSSATLPRNKTSQTSTSLRSTTCACSHVPWWNLNDRPLPDHRDGNGSVDDKLFETKLKVLLKKSGYIIADLAINYSWFDVRVRKLITADGLKMARDPEGWAKANLLYETSKSSGRPSCRWVYSRSTSFGVWLRHQEIEANKVSMMANGLLSSLTKESKGTSDAFKAVLEGMFPFMEKNKGLEDQKLKELMKPKLPRALSISVQS